jgi:hypothetical protein
MYNVYKATDYQHQGLLHVEAVKSDSVKMFLVLLLSASGAREAGNCLVAMNVISVIKS